MDPSHRQGGTMSNRKVKEKGTSGTRCQKEPGNGREDKRLLARLEELETLSRRLLGEE